MSDEPSTPTGDDDPGAIKGMFAPSSISRADKRLEIIAGILLALSTIAIAWSGYQSTRWSGEQADAYSRGNAARTESSKAASRAESQNAIDLSLFIEWIDATTAGDTRKASFYRERFRPEFQEPFREWLALRPLKDAGAPSSPFARESYSVAQQQEAEKLTAEADAYSATARDANQRGDNYVLAAVMFAMVLFFAGMATQFESRQVKAAGLVMAAVLFVAAIAWVALMPVSISL
ncbi:MAG: hypothetical protein ABGX38_04005 [Thermoleophilia bacterium]